MNHFLKDPMKKILFPKIASNFIISKHKIVTANISDTKKRIYNKTTNQFIIFGLASGLIFLYYENRKKDHQIVSILRAFFTGVRIYIMYEYVINRSYKTEEDYKTKLHETHEKCSKMFLDMCLANKGLYVKMGQTISALNHVLPAPWYENLMPLRDKTLSQDFDYVEKIFREDLGKSISQLFSSFESKPLASASIAQVHEATTIDGQRVAVKVQFYYLHKQYPLDIWAIREFCDLLSIVAPQFQFGWMFKLVEEKLKKELDFNLEGKNNELCKEMIKEIPNCFVPKINWDLSSPRILTMEFIDGLNVNDYKSKTKNMNEYKDIIERLIKLFSVQIFRYGYVHADPHSSNIFIRENSGGKPDIILLDHGLYEKLDVDSRKLLAKFWIAGTTSDIPALESISKDMHIDDYSLLWEIFFQRPFLLKRSGEIKLLAKLSREDRKEMLKVAGADRFESITKILQKLPQEYILVLRNLNIVRSLTQDCSEPIDRYFIIAKTAFIETTKHLYGSGYIGIFRVQLSYFWFQLKYLTAKLKYKIIEIYIASYFSLHGTSTSTLY